MWVSLGTPRNPFAKNASLQWKDGQYQLIERLYVRPGLDVLSPLSELVNGSFLFTQSYVKDDGVTYGNRIFRYFVVPEPGTLAFVAALSIGGLYLRRRRVL